MGGGWAASGTPFPEPPLELCPHPSSCPAEKPCPFWLTPPGAPTAVVPGSGDASVAGGDGVVFALLADAGL